MRDRDVRAAVRQKLAAQYAGDAANTRIVEEMGVWSGTVRIDIAVINGELWGYELKSERDTLERLPTQANIYSKVFDRVTLVVGTRHVGAAEDAVPPWWGLIVAKGDGASVRLRSVRDAERNPAPDPRLVAELLWRDEAIAALDVFGLAKGWRDKKAKLLHQRLAAGLSFQQLSEQVRLALKRREGWLGQHVSHQLDMSVDTVANPDRQVRGTGFI
jgi:hypothetical protein